MKTDIQTDSAKAVGPGGWLGIPVRRHPDCSESNCQTCLNDHESLAKYFQAKIGGCQDWLGEYRKWLDAKSIPAEVNGWASRQAFDEKNISAFITAWYAQRSA